jgi:hypothetical protein
MGNILKKTRFSFAGKGENRNFFMRQNPQNSDEYMLFAKKTLQREKLHKFKVIGTSYGSNYKEINYANIYLVFYYGY